VNHDPSLAVGLLNRVGSSEEAFARAFTQCRVGEDRQCGATLRSLDSTVLQQLLQTHHTSWLSDRGLSPFGKVLLDVCGFSVLETIWRRKETLNPLRVRDLLGGPSSPLFLVFLEQLLEIAPSAEVAELLVVGYLARCSSELTVGVPSEWSQTVDQFAGMRLFDVSEAPLEIRWTLRHWRGRVRTSAVGVWLDSIAPLNLGPGAARAHLYTIKLQTLLLELRRFGPETAHRVGLLLEEGSSNVRQSWLDSCRVLWLPLIGKLDEALAFACSRFSQDGAVGFCGEFCVAASDWKKALECARDRSPLRNALLASCADRFSAEELVAQVLPEDQSVSSHLQTIWKAEKLSLLPTILNFAKQY
jgi:hypothetical protein